MTSGAQARIRAAKEQANAFGHGPSMRMLEEIEAALVRTVDETKR